MKGMSYTILLIGYFGPLLVVGGLLTQVAHGDAIIAVAKHLCVKPAWGWEHPRIVS